ncbi:MAG: hypothetical protein HY871_08110 [Chloroflexi bacterium]|nr:hypothetical protein [Chloroflexota bacterium]
MASKPSLLIETPRRSMIKLINSVEAVKRVMDEVAVGRQIQTYIAPGIPLPDLQDLIRNGKALGTDKQVILAAYPKPLQNAVPEVLSLAENATRLAAAAIFANGGFHLLLGERDGALCDPYYPSYTTLRPGFARVMRDYYDFIVCYENFLFDRTLKDVSESFVYNANIRLEGARHSFRPTADAVWIVPRRKAGYLTLSLLNLLDIENTYWNLPHPRPRTLEDTTVILNAGANVKRILLASPDYNLGRPRSLNFETMTNGSTVRFKVPHLDFWDLLILETD